MDADRSGWHLLLMLPGLKIGILGGGQLARMLVLQGHQLGLQMHVLSEQPDDPAAQVCPHWHKGHVENENHVLEFCQTVDLVTFESEFIPSGILRSLESQRKNIFPAPETLRQLQDRLTQKELLVEYRIPTSPFLALQEPSHLDDAKALFQGTCVAKKRLGGYDGKGTFILKSNKNFADFKASQNLSNHEFIIEAFVPFKRELALQVARNAKNEFIFLPLVEIHQHNKRLDWLTGPINDKRIMTLQSQIKIFLKKINYIGLIAFELFDTGRDILVNEVAPRVHNSGHYTLEALNENQFSLHLRAGLGQRFSKLFFRSKAFAMTNLIGQESREIEFPEKLEGALHWYGKEKNTEGRKMGHLTYLGNSSSQLLKMALKERRRIKL